MEEQLITFETAKLAKEKGYGILSSDCAYNYSEENNFDLGINIWTKDDFKNYDIYPAPTQSLLQKWLREVQKIDVVLSPSLDSDKYWVSIYKNKQETNTKLEGSKSFETYELALEFGLYQALELIK